MALELRQQLKMTQQLVMTPQLRQAIRLLQLNRLELTQALREELEQNPLLEEEGDEDVAEVEGEERGLEEIGQKNGEDAFLAEAMDFSRETALKEQDWEEYSNLYETDISFSREAFDPDQPTALDFAFKKTNLASHLQWQAAHFDLDADEQEILFFILGNINEMGLLVATVEEIVAQTDSSPEVVTRLIALVQTMDPPGVGARDVRESLLLQLLHRGKEDTLAAVIIDRHLGLLETRNYKQIASLEGVSVNDVLVAVEMIAALNPFPGREFAVDDIHYVVPDIYVDKVDGEYVITLNNEGLPRLKVSSCYRAMLKNGALTTDTSKNYVVERMRSAEWLIKSIQQRQQTLYKVVKSLLSFQRDFFDQGIAYLKPLVLRDVADDIEMHESTVSRVTTNKYVHTPQGVFELKYFFNAAIRRSGGEDMAAESVRERVRSLIATENQEKPLSDQKLAELLKKEGISIARRTVAKYREQMRILPVKHRRKPKIE